MDINVTVEESERQSILLALAHLAVERPGWDYMLGEIAGKFSGCAMYEKMRDMYKDETP